ncbi:MAG TPA: mechanosensitive ion channel family protein [Rectinemataceae bacterium]|nr:mechanosensitive ion channel family protein [Rectinemataceae bacterium]
MNTKVSGLLQSISEAFGELASAKTVSTVFSVLLILIIGLGIVRLLFNAIKRFSRKGLPNRSAAILENVIKYGGNTLVLLTACKRAGLDISALMGAAGIAGIALGFAAQTSVANIISGLFLFSEGVFRIGDTVQVDTTSGVVEAVDLMCVRIRTFDNRLIRVPNETLIKSNIINISYYPKRRLDLWLSLPNDCDYAAAVEAIRSAVDSEPLALKDPSPVIFLDSITPDGTSVLIGTWFLQANFSELKNRLIPGIVQGLAAKGIHPQARRIEVSSTNPMPGTSLAG